MLNIVTYPDPSLRKPCEEVTSFDEDLKALASEMARAMYKYDGIGLAAPQVGIRKRIITVDVGKGLLKLINPRILEIGGEEEEMDEGCLSLPGVFVPVRRKIGLVRFEAYDINGKPKEWKASGLLARVIQHEVDHLDGVLMIDRTHKPIEGEAKERIKALEEEYARLS